MDHLLIPHHGGVLFVDQGRRVAGDRAKRVVGEDHLRLRTLVVEVVADPLLLQQPADEVQIRLAILSAEIARLVGCLELPLMVQVLDGRFGEDLGDDLPGGLLLEDLEASTQREHPEGGHEVRPIDRPFRVDPDELHSIDHAVDMALHRAPLEAQRGGLAHEGVEREV